MASVLLSVPPIGSNQALARPKAADESGKTPQTVSSLLFTFALRYHYGHVRRIPSPFPLSLRSYAPTRSARFIKVRAETYQKSAN